MIEACTISAAGGFLGLADSMKIILSVSSVFGAIMAIALAGRAKSIGKKSVLLYSHVVLMTFPIVLLTTHTTCGYFCLSCYSDPLHLFSLVVPTTIVLSTVTSLLLVPFALVKMNESRKLSKSHISSVVKRASAKIGLSVPEILVLDSPAPTAFSFRGIKSTIFMSVGMVELFTKKEIEAVILHELMHIKRGSSILKFSGSLFKMFSPVSLFSELHDSSEKEEMVADSFAASIQGTREHLFSAKGKMRDFIEAKKNIGLESRGSEI